jgi:hypothetical protein
MLNIIIFILFYLNQYFKILNKLQCINKKQKNYHFSISLIKELSYCLIGSVFIIFDILSFVLKSLNISLKSFDYNLTTFLSILDILFVFKHLILQKI